MTYYGTQRNWWTRLIRLLITLHTITQHTMPVYDANRAQLQTNHHMMMGLGGGAKHASSTLKRTILFITEAIDAPCFAQRGPTGASQTVFDGEIAFQGRFRS